MIHICMGGNVIKHSTLDSAVEYVNSLKKHSKEWKYSTVTYYEGETLQTAKIVKETRPDPVKESGFYYSPKSNEYAIEYLRRMVKCFDGNKEDLNMSYSLPELLNIWSAWNRCEWDFYPDQWSAKQLERAAKNAKVPEFDDEERPID